VTGPVGADAVLLKIPGAREFDWQCQTLMGPTMELPRRKFLHLAAGAAALPTISRVACAQAYPSQPVHLLVGYGTGGPPDIMGRLVAQLLSERLGQQIIVDNQPGANSNTGTELVVKAPPDGYTLLLVTAPNMINATLYKNLNFNFIRDIAPVASVARAPLVMTVNPSVPANTVLEFITYAKANPGKIKMASGGNGSSPHVAGELFKMMTGVNMVHVPYREAPAAIADLLGGQVQVIFSPIPAVIGPIRTSKLRALAVTTTTRSATLPDIPTVADFVPGYEASIIYGLGAPRNTPPEIIGRLNKEINDSLAVPKIREQLSKLGGTPLMLSPVDFGLFIAAETEKWAKVIKFAGIKLE
jgi:tripartite-type tricarboxylate transporter receptor subunit TctC